MADLCYKIQKKNQYMEFFEEHCYLKGDIEKYLS